MNERSTTHGLTTMWKKNPKPSNYVRYLGIYLDEYLNWSAQLVPPY